MTPAAHWSPDDYYCARDAAQAAWQRAHPQLVMWDVLNGLGETDGPGTTSLVGSSVSPSPPSPTPNASGDPSSWDGEGGLDKPNQGGTA